MERGCADRIAYAASCALALIGLIGCSAYDRGLLDEQTSVEPVRPHDPGSVDSGGTDGRVSTGQPRDAGPIEAGASDAGDAGRNASNPPDDSIPPPPTFDPLSCGYGDCWWSSSDPDACHSAGAPRPEDRPDAARDGEAQLDDIYLGWTQIRLGSSLPDGSASNDAWQDFGLDLDGVCTNSATCPDQRGLVSCRSLAPQIPFDGELCRDNIFASLQPIAAQVPEIGDRFGISEEVFNCGLWNGSYNVIMRIRGYNGRVDDSQVRVDFYVSNGLERAALWECPLENYRDTYPLWRASLPWRIDESTLTGPVEQQGRLPDSEVADPEAYVKHGYLVARLPDGALLRLAGDGMPYRGFPLRVQRGLWVGHLRLGQDGTWNLRDGLATGRTLKQDLILGFRQVGFCPGMGLDPFYDAMVSYVNENADVLASGEVDADAECDALSVGIAFEASQVTPGSAGPIDPLIECCPPGETIEQCSTVCGDGEVTGDEHCDTAIAAGEPGACPSDCAALDACTTQALVGEACGARCVPMPITAHEPGDGCCPEGAFATQDTDCPPVCGNSVVEPGETCDPASSCPSSCTSDNACLAAQASGSRAQCTAACELVPVTACSDGDGCCPNDCTQASDDDCSASCGDGFVDESAGETCEPGSATPCPASCDDAVACTRDVLTGSAANCNAACSHPAITQIGDGDGCCPPGANANNDADCDPVCGNGVREDGERCDGDCPSACSDSQACTADALVGTGCNRRCTFTEITQPASDDGCCPPGAHANDDADCPAVCGNREVELGELCDDGNTASNDGCSASCQIEADQQMCLALLPDNNACGQCSCLDCRTETVACYGSSDTRGNAECAAMVACGRANGCSGTECYCGTAGLFTCLFGGANGPCRSQVEAAARSADPLDIQARSTDANYPLGRANALATCALAQCSTECGL